MASCATSTVNHSQEGKLTIVPWPPIDDYMADADSLELLLPPPSRMSMNRASQEENGPQLFSLGDATGTEGCLPQKTATVELTCTQ